MKMQSTSFAIHYVKCILAPLNNLNFMSLFFFYLIFRPVVRACIWCKVKV